MPTPTAVLAARGSSVLKRKGGRPQEVQYAAGAPKCPACLSKEAKAEWKRQVKHLEAAGIIQQTDGAALAAWCDAWAEFSEVVERLKWADITTVTQAGKVIRSPLLAIRDNAVERLLRLATHFGFSPAARVRLAQPVKEEDDGESQGAARFFKGTG